MAKQNPKERPAHLWKPGQSGNPKGRPKRAFERAYLDATIGSVSLADWSDIIGKAVEQARDGDDRARNFLAKYLMPEQALKLVFATPEESSAEVVFEVTIPAPRIGPHGAQVGETIEGETDADA